jgi:hypothetical protein
MATYGNGLTAVYFAPIAGDGDIGTSWTELGSTEQDSMNWQSAAGQNTEFFIEEQTDPVLVKTQSGSNTITWNCLDFSPTKMEEMFGGTVTGAGTSGDPFIYAAPVGGVTSIERSIKIVNGEGDEFLIVRASVLPTFNASFSKNQIAKVTLTATILTPTKAATPAYKIKYAA